jgi:transketolase
MRNRFAETLARVAREDPRIYIVVADISPAGPIAEFRTQFPERFINVGVAEQAMIGVCAGLALRGMRPFAYTIATFALYRPFEFIRDDLAYQNLPVTVVGIGGGVVYSSLGSTHHAQEDIAIASAIPNMAVIAPCDPDEVEAATEYVASRHDGGPVYLRLGKAGEPVITQSVESPFEFGKIRYFRRGTGDVAVVSYGLMMHQALEVADALEAAGRSVTLVSTPTLKPLDVEGLTDVLREHQQVVVMEEHAPQGGLAAQAKQWAWDLGADCDLRTFTLKDEFIHCYGSHADLLSAHGLSSEKVLRDIG